MTPVPFLSKKNFPLIAPTWTITRNGGFDQSGEWIPHCSWTISRELNRHLTVHIHVVGKIRENRCRPHHHYARLTFKHSSYYIPSTHRSCNSLNNAITITSKNLTHPIFTAAAAYFTSPNHVHCISSINQYDTPPSSTPLLSSFLPPDPNSLPHTGIFADVHYYHHNPPHTSTSIIHTFPFGHSINSTTQSYPHWLPPLS